MGITRVKVVLRKNKKDKEGYLKIRTTANRKSRFKTLGIKIHEKFWNEAKQEIRSSHPKSIALNKYINKELEKHSNSINIPTYIPGDKTTMVQFFQRNIDLTSVPGTKNIKRGTYGKLTRFLEENKLSHLEMGDLHPDHVQRFYNFLKGEVSINTATHHIKIFKIVFNRAVKEGLLHSNAINPFSSVRLTYREPEVKSLTELQLKNLQQTNYFRPNKYLSLFLFSLFAHGLRKSDVITLRWKHLDYAWEKVKLSKEIRKSLKYKSFNLSPIALYYLRLQLYDFVPELKIEVEKMDKDLEKHRDNIKMLKNRLDRVKDSSLKKAEKFEEIYRLEDKLNYEMACYEETNFYIYEKCGLVVKMLRKKIPNEFVFDVLKNSGVTERMNRDEEFKIYDRKAKLYNYHLRRIGEEHDISRLTPHMARHTFFDLLNETGADLQSIQLIAGHSDPKQTKAYLRKIKSNEERIEDNDRKISDRFLDFN